MTRAPDTLAIADFMTANGQTVRPTPTSDITHEERLLRARLVLEEAIELADALGVIITLPEGSDGILRAKTFETHLDEFAEVDLVEALDAIVDITYVNKGTASTLGLNPDSAFEAVHFSNMAKVGPDELVVRDPKTGKILKPEGWVPPTQALRDLIVAAGGVLPV